MDTSGDYFLVYTLHLVGYYTLGSILESAGAVAIAIGAQNPNRQAISLGILFVCIGLCLILIGLLYSSRYVTAYVTMLRQNGKMEDTSSPSAEKRELNPTRRFYGLLSSYTVAVILYFSCSSFFQCAGAVALTLGIPKSSRTAVSLGILSIGIGVCLFIMGLLYGCRYFKLNGSRSPIKRSGREGTVAEYDDDSQRNASENSSQNQAEVEVHDHSGKISLRSHSDQNEKELLKSREASNSTQGTSSYGTTSSQSNADFLENANPSTAANSHVYEEPPPSYETIMEQNTEDQKENNEGT